MRDLTIRKILRRRKGCWTLMASLLLILHAIPSRCFLALQRPSTRHLSLLQQRRTTLTATQCDNDAYPASSSSSSNRYDLKLLLVDHYDSFTYNLVDLCSQYTLQPPTVVAWNVLPDLQKLLASKYDGIILSPGPGKPTEYATTLQLLQHLVLNQNASSIPVLGVCLGHQMLGLAYNASVVSAPEPIHGQVWECRLVEQHDETDEQGKGQFAARAAGANDLTISSRNVSRLFENVTKTFHATRYHSLQVVLNEDSSLLKATAVADSRNNATTSDEMTVGMAMESETHPHFGVQFHPESIGSLDSVGRRLIQNFLSVCNEYRRERKVEQPLSESTVKNFYDLQQSASTHLSRTGASSAMMRNKPTVYIHQLSNCSLSPEQVMLALYRNEPYAYWLDHASEIDKDSKAVSILGASRERVEYWNNGSRQGTGAQKYIVEYHGCDESHKTTTIQDIDILEYLSLQHSVERRTDAVTMVKFGNKDGRGEPVFSVQSEQDSDLPFDFRGGHVGYLGYEVRFDTLRYLQLEEGFRNDDRSYDAEQSTKDDPTIPTAAFMFATKSCVYHHATQTWYLVTVVRNEQEDPKAVDWMRKTTAKLATLQANNCVKRDHLPSHQSTSRPQMHPRKPAFVPNRSRATYSDNFRKCMDHIYLGDSYQLCLTNQLEATIPSDATFCPLNLYQTLRRANPAPHAAYLNWNFHQSIVDPKGSLAICCSSPERFVSVSRHTSFDKLSVETKPIKGTRARVTPSRSSMQLSYEESREDAKRADDLRASVKDRAENLMIVDLLRNDLSRVCEAGSVHVSKMMDIESYTTVHQMVSTIRGVLDPKATAAVDLLKACFPGGSMTGAPKIRSMELLHQMEQRTNRGPYSGSMGYISVNGCADMNIIIRSAVLSSQMQNETKLAIGSGGAITALSDDNDEYDEMMLKAAAVIQAIEKWLSSD
ncbi:hypothetical protein MPSEU_000827600 [Mayamaea pseudoterrestris]|nr:hypothetical protein MPSEU_000827600 [Mayamaea pseudoterrestris]